MMKRAAFALLASLTMLASALAANEGTAVGVNPDAVSRSSGAERTLVVGSDVSVGERIVTGPSGHVELLFDDQTKLVVGPRSALVIETYLLKGSGADTFAVNALAGTFRFISGNSPKPVYSIDTPTASIAVRGTRFDLTVSGSMNFTLLYEGALTQCQGKVCIELDDRCDIGVTGGNQTGVYNWLHEDRPEFVGFFPLPNIQSAFPAPFRVQGAQACLASRAEAPATSIVPLQTPAPTQTFR